MSKDPKNLITLVDALKVSLAAENEKLNRCMADNTAADAAADKAAASQQALADAHANSDVAGDALRAELETYFDDEIDVDPPDEELPPPPPPPPPPPVDPMPAAERARARSIPRPGGRGR